MQAVLLEEKIPITTLHRVFIKVKKVLSVRSAGSQSF